MGKIVTKNMAIFAGAFALVYWFLYGQFQNMFGSYLGFLGSWTGVGLMFGFGIVFLILYDRFVKKPVV